MLRTGITYEMCMNINISYLAPGAVVVFFVVVVVVVVAVAAAVVVVVVFLTLICILYVRTCESINR